LNNKSDLPFISKPGFYDWEGDHKPNGILFMYGKNIKPNKRVDASVVDIVPTILSAFGLPVPTYMDGEIIFDAFIEKPKVKKVKATHAKNTLSKNELDTIKKLRKKIK